MTPSTRRHALRLGVFLACSSPLGAVELADLAGDWALTRLDTPSRLREIYFNTETEATRISKNSLDYAQPGEILTNAFYPDPLSVSSVGFNLAANGSITGGETGTVVAVGNNRLTYTDGIEVETVYSNVPGDILMASSRDVDQQNLSLCLKKPASLTTSELEGTWNLVSFVNPDDISKNFFNGRIVDTWFVGESRQTVGAVTLDSSGNMSGLFNGTVAATGPGTVNVTIPGEGTIPFVCNDSKSVLVTTLDGGSEQEYVILVRKPDTLATADLAGTWRLSSVIVPTSLTETYYNNTTVPPDSRQADSSDVAQENEELVDIFHTDLFELNRLFIQIEPSGNFTGTSSGTMTANGNQSFNVFTDGDNYTFYLNADKTVMISGNVNSDSHELIVGVRTGNTLAQSVSEKVDLKIIPSTTGGPMVISWNSAENAKLQGATTLGDWQDIPEAVGSDSFVVDPNELGFKFFRVGVEP